eukprot:3347744-Amphidinium_carterae.3
MGKKRTWTRVHPSTTTLTHSCKAYGEGKNTAHTHHTGSQADDNGTSTTTVELQALQQLQQRVATYNTKLLHCHHYTK